MLPTKSRYVKVKAEPKTVTEFIDAARAEAVASDGEDEALKRLARAKGYAISPVSPGRPPTDDAAKIARIADAIGKSQLRFAV